MFICLDDPKGSTSMFHVAEDLPAKEPAAPITRQQWMALLCRAPIEILEAALGPDKSAGHT
jgi:hypothetical protein